MERKKIEGTVEKLMLLGIIVSTQVLSRLAPVLQSIKLKNRVASQIIHWCLDYYQKYRKAPGREIYIYYETWRDETEDEDLAKMIGQFLQSISDDVDEEINPDHVIDLSSKFLTELRIKHILRLTRAHLMRGDTDRAEQTLQGFIPLEISSESFVDFFSDEERLKELFIKEETENLIQFTGPLGQFFGDAFTRDALLSFMAPEKRGKTFFLIEMAFRAAVQNRRRVLFYSAGDMSLKQVLKRIAIRTVKRPFKAGRVKIPVRFKSTKPEPKVEFKTKEWEEPLRLSELMDSVRRKKIQMGTQSSLLKVKSAPNSTLRVVDILVEVERMSKEGWVPDVIVIDYADILAPEVKRMEYRHQINETWKALRRLSQETHSLVITATQSDSASYDKDLIRRQNFSEDKRKLSHVTGMVGINQTREEKLQQVFRLNWIIRREEAYDEGNCVYTAGALELSCPSIISSW